MYSKFRLQKPSITSSNYSYNIEKLSFMQQTIITHETCDLADV